MRKSAIVAVAAALASAELMAIQGTISTENDTKSGDIKWQPRSKSYALSYKKGKTDVSAEFPLADVTALDIPKPQGYDKAVEMVEKGQGASAIGILEKITTDYRMLVWDKPAGRYLAMAHISAGNAQKAYEKCQAIIAEDRAAAYKGELAYAYWQALLALGKEDQLDGLLKKAVSDGDRASSAAAQLMRGDIIVKNANGSPEKLREALREGYLRVALMYAEPECARERQEAMLKAAQCFDGLRQASRAERLRQQAKAM